MKRNIVGATIALCVILPVFMVFVWPGLKTPTPPVEATTVAAEQTQNLVDEAAKLRGPDAKTLTDKWPMKPPKVEVMSDWSPRWSGTPEYEQADPYRYIRYIKIDGRLAIELAIEEGHQITSRQIIFVSEVW